MSPSQLPVVAVSPPSAPLWRTLLLVCALLIVYGSLYPFGYTPPASFENAWSAFIGNHSLWTTPGDVAGNIVLFLPFGACATASMPSGRLARRMALLAGSAVFAFAVQSLQIWYPPRDAALADVLWNVVGTALGMVIASQALRHASPRRAALTPDVALAIWLLALWVITQWAPLVPTIDWQAIKDSMRPLLLHPEIDTPALLLTFVRVLAVGQLIAALPGPAAAAPKHLAVLLAALLAGKPFIAGQMITLSTVAGMVAGYVGWLLLTGRRQATGATALLMLAAHSIAALAPFEIRNEPTTFHLLPFEALLEGSMETNSRALLDACFLYGALLWLAQRAGARVRGCAVVLALWVGGVEYLQVWINGRTGDITEPLLVMMTGLFVHATCRTASPSRRPHSSVRAHH